MQNAAAKPLKLLPSSASDTACETRANGNAVGNLQIGTAMITRSLMVNCGLRIPLHTNRSEIP